MLPEVEVFCLDSAVLAGHEPEIVPFIPASYAEGWEKRRPEALEKLAAGFLLSRVLGVSDDCQITRNPYGKPYLRHTSSRKPRYFNLSDDEGMVALAVAEVEVGADIHLAGIADPQVLRKYCPQESYAAFLAASGNDKPLIFARAWTALEARLKCLGTGFAGYDRRHPEVLDGLWVETACIPGGYVVSCAAYHPFTLRVDSLTYEDLTEGVTYDKSI